mmetsp:Transcript_39213/g.110845  ORF Transcript_39213/g.110845 Transcript_39213/m.110845 type:complete len:225 (+) Transcript_39213:132-806(+)
MGATCNKEERRGHEPTLQDATVTLDRQINELERRIARVGHDAKIWAARADTEPMAKTIAMQCLKEKKQYEQQRDRLMGMHFNIEGARFQEEQAGVTLMAARAMQLGHERLKDHKEALDCENLEELMDSMQDLTLDLQEAQGALARDGMLDGNVDDDIEAEFAKLRGETLGIPAAGAGQRTGIPDELEAEFQRLAAEAGASGAPAMEAAPAGKGERRRPISAAGA